MGKQEAIQEFTKRATDNRYDEVVEKNEKSIVIKWGANRNNRIREAKNHVIENYNSVSDIKNEEPEKNVSGGYRCMKYVFK